MIVEEIGQNSEIFEYLKKIPDNIWIQIFSYLTDQPNIMHLLQINKFFYKLCQQVHFWHNIYLQNFSPELYNKILGEKKIDIEDPLAQHKILQIINWKQEVQKCFSILNEYKAQLKSISEKKDEGNLHFSKKEYDKALYLYRECLSKESLCKQKKFKDLISVEDHINYVQLKAKIYANISQCDLKLEEYHDALTDGKHARKKLDKLKNLISDDESYFNQYGQLIQKVDHRITTAAQFLLTHINFVRYSNQPVEGVRVGTLLIHDGSGYFFNNTKVLLVQHVRGEGVQGLILNKRQVINGRDVYIGGPCEQTTKYYLHNIAEAPGAEKVLDQVYFGGDISAYMGNPNYKVREYMGISSWFDGQLDGEIRADGWQWHNECTQDMVFENM